MEKPGLMIQKRNKSHNTTKLFGFEIIIIQLKHPPTHPIPDSLMLRKAGTTTETSEGIIELYNADTLLCLHDPDFTLDNKCDSSRVPRGFITKITSFK